MGGNSQTDTGSDCRADCWKYVSERSAADERDRKSVVCPLFYIAGRHCYCGPDASGYHMAVFPVELNRREPV